MTNGLQCPLGKKMALSFDLSVPENPEIQYHTINDRLLFLVLQLFPRMRSILSSELERMW